MANKNIFKGFYNWTFLLIVIIGIIILNIISSYLNQRWDMTEDDRFSLAEGTELFLQNDKLITDRIIIKIYLAGNLPSELKLFKNALEDKLKEFKQIAGKKIEYQFINPSIGTEQEQKEIGDAIFDKGNGIIPMNVVYMKDGAQNQLLVWPGAEIDYKGYTVKRVQLLPGTASGNPFQLNDPQFNQMVQNSINNLEYMLISTIKRAITEKRPRIGFLQGHGELTFQQTQRARALISPNYSIKDVNLDGSISALEGVDGLIIARPRSEFSDKDLYLIDQFVLNGGRLMCFMDALSLNEDTLDAKGTVHTIRNNTRLDKMLFDYGLKLNDNLVIDVNCAPKPVPLAKVSLIPWFFHVLATPSSHPIARNLEPVSLKYVNEIQFVGNNPKNRLTPVLTSSTNASKTGMAPMVSLGLALNYGEHPQLVANPKDEANKLCLAGLSEGYYESHFKNRIVEEFAKNPDSKYKEKSIKEGKILLVGNGRFLQNDYDSMKNVVGDAFMYRPSKINNLRYDAKLAELGIPLYYGNQEFIQNMVDYMMGDNTVLDIRSRQIDIHEIDNEKVKAFAGYYKIINLIVPCLTVVILGFIIYYFRKRKFTNIK
ncbi:MAG: Gldg family protein [Flavobacteriia bacterium]|nr:Gldg family protein [Flavobacteriia bacterium]